MSRPDHPVSRRALLGGAVAGGVVLGLPSSAHAQLRTPAGGANGLLLKDDFTAIAGWRRHGVLMQQDLPWESALLQDPCLAYATGTGARFKMWYGSLTNIGYATSEDGLRWTKRHTPVVTQTLATEAKALNQPSVVFQGGIWHMTYFGVAANGEGQVHYASASAPEGPWIKRGVVLTSTMPWEDRYVYNSSLLYDQQDQVWKIWYTAGKIKSAGGEPRYICYATADHPAGPWRKHPANPILRPMNDGGWASLGVGGPNVRKLGASLYETRIVGWQADYPSRGGRLTSRDGIAWSMDRASLDLDLGVVGGPEDSMIYRQFIVEHDGRQFCFYNTKNNRPGWNETINLAIWDKAVETVDPALWTMTQGPKIPTGASFEVRDGAVHSLGNARERPQVLQGNRLIEASDYAIDVTVTPAGAAARDRGNVILARATDRANYYYAGMCGDKQSYVIGIVEAGQDRPLATKAAASANGPYRLTFELLGNDLRLLANGQTTLAVTDPTLRPQRSYIGLATTYGDGRAAFSSLRVRRIAAG
jgi:hypothetical protein